MASRDARGFLSGWQSALFATRYSLLDEVPPMRLKDKIAIVIGAGQSPGEGMGNGRATVLRFAQEGAKVLAVDNNLGSAEETVAMVKQAGGGECVAHAADVTREQTMAEMVAAARSRWGRIDILHYNV